MAKDLDKRLRELLLPKPEAADEAVKKEDAV
jgi:hypothetical protein